MEVLAKGTYSGLVDIKKSHEGLITSITRYDQSDFNGDIHYHVNAHFGLTIEGGCVEKKHNSYELSAGDISHYMAGEKHQLMRIAKPSRRVNLEIEQHFADAYNLTDDVIQRTVTKSPDAKFLMVKIYHELLTNDDYSALSIQTLLLELFHQPGKTVGKNKAPAWVNTVCDYLYEHCHEPLTLAVIAKVGGIHEVTVSKYFPKYVGCNLGEYMRKLRIEKAINLIKATDASMTNIAYQCGFFDQSHFNRSFKRVNGILPGRFKRL